MSEKHLTELPWKTLVIKQGLKDIGLAKALVAYANFSNAQDFSKALEALKEVVELAAKLRKTYAAKDEVVVHLEEMVKEVKKTTPVLEAKTKSAAAAQAKGPTAGPGSGKADSKPSAEDQEEEKEAAELKKNLKQQMVSALAQVKARAPGDPEQQIEPKPQLQFMAYLAGKNCAVVVGRRVGVTTKKMLPEIAGGVSGGKYVQGECIFEKNAHTFVLEQVPGGLAKKFATALNAETGQKYKVRVRTTDGSTELDSDTDADAEVTAADPGALFIERFKALLPSIKAAVGTSAGDEAKLKASEAGVFAGKKDFVQANALLDQAQAALKKSAASTSTSKDASSAATGAPAPGLVKKRKFLVERWQRIPLEVSADLQKLKEAIEREMPSEDADLLIELSEDYLDEFYTEMKEAIDNDINSGDAQYKNAISSIRAFRSKISDEPLIQHLKVNTLKVDVSVESILLEALAEVEQSLAS